MRGLVITKKLRFEVFKRDSFTCQYCGQMAPDVVLEVDHINPVKHGGKNEILNLITSCMDCNRGKGARKLDDNHVVKKQQNQLKELNEKRQQLKQMLAWKQELEKFNQEQINIINSIYVQEMKVELSEYGKKSMLKLIKKFGIDEVIKSITISINQYYECNNPKSINKVTDYIERILVRRKLNKHPLEAHASYIRGILFNRFNNFDRVLINNLLKIYLIDEESAEFIKNIARECDDINQFVDIVDWNLCFGED